MSPALNNRMAAGKGIAVLKVKDPRTLAFPGSSSKMRRNWFAANEERLGGVVGNAFLLNAEAFGSTRSIRKGTGINPLTIGPVRGAPPHIGRMTADCGFQ